MCDLRPLPLHDRREVLEGLVEDAQAVFAVRRLTDNGHEAGPRCRVGASRASSGRPQVDVSSRWALLVGSTVNGSFSVKNTGESSDEAQADGSSSRER